MPDFIKYLTILRMVQRSEQEKVRIDKLARLREGGFTFPNDVKISATSEDVRNAKVSEDPESSERYTVAGRIVQMRVMGKAAFLHILDGVGRLQFYVRKDVIGEEAFKEFKQFDIGDVVSASGYPFVTKTGEQSLATESIRLLTKSLIPLPEKWHGLTDVEARYRNRYVDLIANPDVREVFKTRAKVIREIRSFLDDRDYIEVETPTLHYSVGGATAKPFLTHYNALDTDMVLRIALELPLKKLVVGGLERVYEIGRVFRNEGVSKKHNPEFTMLEFYQAYTTFEDMMEITEQMFLKVLGSVRGEGMVIPFGDVEVDMTPPWPRISMLESVYQIGGVDRSIDLSELKGIHQVAEKSGIQLGDSDDWGRSLEAVWDQLVEPKLINPTFITHHPYSISPLARKSDEDPKVTDRFELLIAGMEMANAFSELNDPIDQRERFEAQVARKESGDEEACDLDEDYLRALEYGLPPTGGEGVGIDRLVMLLTNSPTIRDVLLFPQLKPEVQSDVQPKEQEGE